MLSSTSEYALKAVLYLAGHDAAAPVRVGEIAEALHIPRNYLAKILHELARSGVLMSARGKLGGFRLARPPEHISLLDIVSHFDRIEGRRLCLLGRRACTDRHPCPAHSRWKAVSEQTAAFFRETNVADLLKGPALVA
ncbi:MAG TPA: Rrf2 family transcriptional regulator [Gemmatimonadales bacterium]|nr:Rrf2 family transcriptional regulator [Gemmatimonadales bacterium]